MTRVKITVDSGDYLPDAEIEVTSDGMPRSFNDPESVVINELLNQAVAAVRRTYGI